MMNPNLTRTSSSKWIFKQIVLVLTCFSGATSNSVARNVLPVGAVEIPDGVTMVVVNKNGEQITVTSAREASRLAVGEYRIESWTLERKDEDGNIWQLKGSELGSKGIFDVVEGKKVELSIGASVVSNLAAHKYDSTYYLRHSLRGRLSETIEITRNGNRPEAPKLQISNADDSYQETLNFEYG